MWFNQVNQDLKEIRPKLYLGSQALQTITQDRDQWRYLTKRKIAVPTNGGMLNWQRRWCKWYRMVKNMQWMLKGMKDSREWQTIGNDWQCRMRDNHCGKWQLMWNDTQWWIPDCQGIMVCNILIITPVLSTSIMAKPIFVQQNHQFYTMSKNETLPNPSWVWPVSYVYMQNKYIICNKDFGIQYMDKRFIYLLQGFLKIVCRNIKTLFPIIRNTPFAD